MLASLQEIVTVASSSAAVARAQLGRHLIEHMRGAAPGALEPDDEAIDLALFLLGRGRDPFKRHDWPLGARNGGDAALAQFRRDGIVESRWSGVRNSWRLTEAACRALAPQ